MLIFLYLLNKDKYYFVIVNIIIFFYIALLKICIII